VLLLMARVVARRLRLQEP